jgi:RNA polymerase sigma-70 factor (ECF subfamily)
MTYDNGMYLINHLTSERLTDNELLELAKCGDQSAFTEIVKRFKPRIALTIFGMVGKCDEADDIGQEVFIRFYKSMENFRGDSALGTYLTRIAINLSLNEISRRKRKSIFSFDKIIEEGFDIKNTNNPSNETENQEIIQFALQKLSAKYRSVIVLRLIDGYSTEETAKILGIPLGTVLSRLTRAQIKLKEYLQPHILET